jgi:sensor histidine kinase YesM
MDAHQSRLALAPPGWQPGFLRRALSGVTPAVVAFVATLLLLRALSTTVQRVAEGLEHGSGEALWSLCVSFVVLVVGAAPMLVIVIATANLGPQRGSGRVAALTAAVVFSALIGAVARKFVWDVPWVMVIYVWPRYAILGGLLTIVGEFYRLEATSNVSAQQAELDRAALERETTEASLQVLQAQIEPHFLFNTLANARRLYTEDRAVGRTMLESLMRYLEVALPQMRHGESTLERDAELIEAFLHIQQIRMGPRLAFSIDIPPALRTHDVPPMMLLTLVENAIKHGLNPSVQGGLIHVTARAEDEQLMLTVADTGIGFASAWGAGIGLANISARLAARFGDRAALTLANNEFGGATATIALPLADGAAG